MWELPTHMSGECTVCTWPAYSSLSSMGISTRRPSFSSSLSMMHERGAADEWAGAGHSHRVSRSSPTQARPMTPPAPPGNEGRGAVSIYIVSQMKVGWGWAASLPREDLR